MPTLLTFLCSTFFAAHVWAADAPLAGLRWKYRPLVVLAPSSAHPALKKQQHHVNAARDGVLERDMILVQAWPGGGMIGDEPISAVQAQALLDTFRQGAAFAVLLVGKDGTVKARHTEPIDLESLFALIDTMPMRRQEMRRDRAQ